MIARARYVRCDQCGDPAMVVTGDAAEARREARREGFVRVGGRDLCVRCRPPRGLSERESLMRDLRGPSDEVPA